MAQDLLWEYAKRRSSVDAEFSNDLAVALRTAGYVPGEPLVSLAMVRALVEKAAKSWDEEAEKYPTNPSLGARLKAETLRRFAEVFL